MEENVIGCVGDVHRAHRALAIVAAAVGVCTVGCETPPPHAEPLARIAWLQDRRTGTRELVPLLAFPDPAVRRRAALAIGAIGDDDGVHPLLRVIREDPDLSVQRAAVFALGRLPGPDRSKDLTELLAMHADDPSLRAAILAGVRPVDRGLWQPIQVFLMDETAEVRGQTALALLRLHGDRTRGGAAPPPDMQNLAAILKTALNQETDTTAHWRIVYAMAHAVAPGTRSSLTAISKSKRFGRFSRLFAIRGLGHLPADAGTRAVLLDLLAEEDWALVYEAVNALARPDPSRDTGSDQPPPRYADSKVALAMGTQLAHGNVHVRQRVAQVLGGYPDASSVTPLLRASLGQGPAMKSVVLPSIARQQGLAALPLLDSYKSDPSWLVRVGTARALACLPDSVAVPRLKTLFLDQDIRVRTAALEALASFRRSDLALQLAIEAAKVRELALRETIGNTMTGIADPRAIPALMTSYQDSPGLDFAEARKLMVRSIAGLGQDGPETVTFLRNAALDPHGAVRNEAGRALRKLNLAVPDTSQLEQEERDQWVTPELGKAIPWSLLSTRPRLRVTTRWGSFQIELYPEYALMHCYNLLQLVKRGQYDGRVWHRVVPNFVVQGGDLRGDGFGANPVFGEQLRDEINPMLYLDGVVGMPKTRDPNTGGDQIFITTVPTPHLDRNYTVLGRVTEGMGVIEQIQVGNRITRIEIFSK